MTPDIYRKFEGESIRFDPRTAWGLVACLKDFGAPFLRILADQIKATETLRKKVLYEEARLEEIKSYLEAR